MASKGTPSVAGGAMAEAVLGLVRSNNPGQLELVACVAIGASGAPTITQNGVAGNAAPIGITRSSTGVYAITYPIMTASATSLCYARVDIIQSAALTISKAVFTAFDPTAGTGSFTCSLNTTGTAVDPANGDALMITIKGGLASGIW